MSHDRSTDEIRPSRDRLREIRSHIDAALAYLDIDDADLDRLANPRHTDKDALVYLPNRVANALAAARRELQAAVDELTKEAP